MRRLIVWILAIFAGCAFLLVTEDSGFAARGMPPSEIPSIDVPPNETTDLTLWAPPNKEFELVALPEKQGWHTKSFTDSETLVRPAWGLFVLAVITNLILWTNAENGFTVRMMGSGLS